MQRNEVGDADLDVLLSLPTSVSCTSEEYLNTVASWEIDARLNIVRYSLRFSAVCIRNRDTSVFFTVTDNEYFVFALSNDAPIQRNIPTFRIPTKGLTWTALQETLVRRFKSDEHVRAVAAAVMISTRPTGAFKGAAEALLPARERTLPSCELSFDAPLDADMITLIADACLAQGKLVFVSGSGYAAESTTSEMMGKLKRVRTPRRTEPFQESGSMLMPFLFH